jgi:3-hydroxyisobutyrate dehydrogenase-like beta-hydroxyacid dehydrogenase
MADEERLGFIGLGAMGGPMSANMASAGHAMTVYDAAGTAARAPAGSQAAESSWEVAAQASTVLLSLPDGEIVNAVVDELLSAPDRVVETVVDLSTIGISAAEAVAAKLEAAGVGYLDAPVSGGVSGATAGSLALMAAGSRETFERLDPVLASIAKNRFHVGERPGQGQATKLLNNFLSGTATAATSEAVLFGLRHDLEMATILDVLNASSGRNTATSGKFPQTVLTRSFDGGFAAALMAKDVRLFRERSEEIDQLGTMGATVAGLWAEMSEAMPGADSMRMYEYLEQKLGAD